MIKAAIYHFTDHSEKRPIVYQKQLETLKNFAASKGLDVAEVFCDRSLLRRERPEFDRFLASSDQFGALVAKDFYHISKNTMKTMSIMQKLLKKGLCIYTMENGTLYWEHSPPFDKPLKAAAYYCHLGTAHKKDEIVSLRDGILTLFAEKKTNWHITGRYIDDSEHQNDGEQVQLMRLIEERDQYDVVLVNNMNDIHWRTANFCRIRSLLQMDIYSLQDGYLKYND